MSGEALQGKTEQLKDEHRPYLGLLAMFPCSGLLATGKTPIKYKGCVELMVKYREKELGWLCKLEGSLWRWRQTGREW